MEGIFMDDGSFGSFGKDMAVDLGTTNTLIYVKGEGIVLNEPSLVALNTITNHFIAAGEKAMSVVGRTPAHIVVIRPLKDGVIADFDVTEKMLRYFIQKVHQRRSPARPRVVMAVPSGITGVEQRAVEEAAIQAGAREVFFIEQLMAAAIGAGMPIDERGGNILVDIGGGTTEVAVISLGGIVTSHSMRVGGDEMDEAIISYIEREYHLSIGAKGAESLKVSIGSAFELADEEIEGEIKGRDLTSGLPKTVAVTAREIRHAVEGPVNQVVQTIKDNTLEKTTPELASDIKKRGIFLVGGGALLRGLEERLRHETGLPVVTAKDPQLSVVIGCWKCLE